ncbi:Beta-1 [Mactra antiquata]
METFKTFMSTEKNKNSDVLQQETIHWSSYTDKDLALCKKTIRHLHGRMNTSLDVKATDYDKQIVLADIKYGGIYRPRDCKQKDSVAIVIPYRDRIEHLNILINHLHAMLQRQKLYYGIYVVEMSLPVQFNRGLLANAGFMTAQSIGTYSCYIIHDVDLLPLNDFNEYKCSPNNPKHLVTKNSKFKNDALPYTDYIGGVLALTTEQYYRVNGFSNLYFGWGGEDDDMHLRIKARNFTIVRNAEHIGVYLALPHNGDSSNPPNPYRDLLLQQGAYRMNVEGLSSISYIRKSLEFRQLYTWVLIDCVESEIMSHYSNLRISGKDYIKKNKIRTHSKHYVKNSNLHVASKLRVNRPSRLLRRQIVRRT